jgi:hypothetical protein
MTYGTIQTWERVGNEIENGEAGFVLLAQNGNMRFHCIHSQQQWMESHFIDLHKSCQE